MEVQQQEPGKGKAIASLVLGILSLVFMWFGYGALVAIVMAVVGIVLGISARKEMPQGTAGIATAGMVCSIVALALAVVIFVSCVLCASCFAISGLSGYYS